MIKIECKNPLLSSTITNYLVQKNFVLSINNQKYQTVIKITNDEKFIDLEIDNEDERLTEIFLLTKFGLPFNSITFEPLSDIFDDMLAPNLDNIFSVWFLLSLGSINIVFPEADKPDKRIDDFIWAEGIFDKYFIAKTSFGPFIDIGNLPSLLEIILILNWSPGPT